MKRTGLVLISLIICCCTLAAQSIAGKLDALVSSEKVLTTSEVGISVFNLTQGKQVYAYQDKKLYRPASIEKVITSVTALAELREYFQYTDCLYRNYRSGQYITGRFISSRWIRSGVYG